MNKRLSETRQAQATLSGSCLAFFSFSLFVSLSPGDGVVACCAPSPFSLGGRDGRTEIPDLDILL